MNGPIPYFNSASMTGAAGGADGRVVSNGGRVTSYPVHLAALMECLSLYEMELSENQLAACKTASIPIKSTKDGKYRAGAVFRFGPYYTHTKVLMPNGKLPRPGYADQVWARGQQPEFAEWQ